MTGRIPGATVDRYELLLQHAGEGIYGLDTEGRVTFVNPAAERLLGYSRDELVGRRMHPIMHYARRDGSPYPDTECHIHAVLRDGVTRRIDDEVFWRRDGTPLEVEYTAAAVQEDGRVTGAVVLFIDVTDRKRAEDELQETLAYQRRLLDAMSDVGIGLFVVDAEYRIQEMNSVMVGAFGDRVGEVCYQSVGESESPCSYCRMGEVIGEGRSVRYQVNAPNGRIYDVTAVPLRGRDGTISKLEIILDITEPHRARELLGKQLAIHMFLLDFSRRCISLPTGGVDAAIAETLEDIGLLMGADRSYIFRIDEGRQTISNVHEWCGPGIGSQRGRLQEISYDAVPWWMDRLHGLEVVALSSLEDLPAEAAAEREIFERQSIDALIAVPIHRDGDVEGFVGLDLVGRRREWTSEERQVLEMLANTLALVFERRRVEDALYRSQFKLRELAAHRERDREDERTRIAREIHDELGQYLTALRMDTALLQSRYGGGDPGLVRQIEGMKETISTTIDVVRNIATALRPHALNMGLVYAAEWLLSDLQERAGIQCRLDAPLAHLDIDDERATALFRILQESLTNIARHARASEVVVRIECAGGFLTLQVWDNGAGFDPTEVRSRKAFGLMGIRERALILGGSSRIDSRPGGGTALSVRIPCGRTDDERDRETAL